MSEEGESGARQRNMTAAYTESQITLGERNFKNAMSTYRRRANKALTFITDNCQTEDIRKLRDLSQESLDELCDIFAKIEGLKENCTVESEKLENVEADHQILMQNISLHIRELENNRS